MLFTFRNKSISPMNQLLIALRFYATGSFLQTIGDTINISKSSSSKIVKKVSQAIASLSPNYIKMPSSNEEILRIQTDFFSKARLPRIIGSLDCTHVKIQSPGMITFIYMLPVLSLIDLNRWKSCRKLQE